jgi:hypothetical protein
MNNETRKQAVLIAAAIFAARLKWCQKARKHKNEPGSVRASRFLSPLFQYSYYRKCVYECFTFIERCSLTMQSLTYRRFALQEFPFVLKYKGVLQWPLPFRILQLRIHVFL